MTSAASAPNAAPIEVVFVMLAHTLALDWAGPAEAFRLANQRLAKQGLAPAFILRFVGPGAQVPSSVGLHWAGIEPLPLTLNAPTWLVLMGRPDDAHLQYAANNKTQDDTEQRVLTHWLRSVSKQLQNKASQSPNRLITICAGALLAAKAGILAHARVTTHHLELDELQSIEPLCQVQANRVFVLDDEHGVYSSAGITTGIDLAVHLVAKVCGAAVAARVAQVMVMPLRREANDAEQSPLLAGRAHLHAGMHRVQDAVCANPRSDWSVPSMAALANTSPRHLARLFAQYAQQSPLAYLQSIRLHLAQSALAAGHGMGPAAALAGFSSDAQLRRVRAAANTK
jgi:transcriptional regulator GlxA family with amidase domain